MRDVDVVVVGAGVVGLAVAAACARSGRSVLTLESDGDIARGVTSRNSEILHAGIYYPADSLKARLCTQGRELTYAWCAERNVPHRKIGKLIVASQPDEISVLEDLKGRAEANGVPGMTWLEADQVQRLEPQVRSVAALLSPETGIVDTHAFALSLLAEAASCGANLLLHHEVVGLEACAAGWRVIAQLAGESETQRLECGVVVNAAGLDSDRVAALAGVDVDACGYRMHLCKGDYFSLEASAPIQLAHLVYPVPTQAGLGIHATLDLGGRIRFGPDTLYVEERDFRVDSSKARLFAESVQRYLPELRAEWLQPDYAGIRPKLAGPGESFRDFVVTEESDAGQPGLINCVGIESPGLTAALAIGDYVVGLL